jgi:hypothetical protein
MTWNVKSLGDDGSVAERLCENQTEVADALRELRGQGHTAWVEDDLGHPIGDGRPPPNLDG